MYRSIMYAFIGDSCQEKMFSVIPEPCTVFYNNCSYFYPRKGDIVKSIYGLWLNGKWPFAMLFFLIRMKEEAEICFQ